MKPVQSNILIREGRPAEIMVVEDNSGDALLITRALREGAIENNVIVANSAEEALRMLQREGEHAARRLPDLILLDLSLPRMSGKDLLGTVKAAPALRHIPVVVLSGSQVEEDVARSYELHASAYVVKPMDFDKFRHVVTTIEQFFFLLAVLADSRESG